MVDDAQSSKQNSYNKRVEKNLTGQKVCTKFILDRLHIRDLEEINRKRFRHRDWYTN